MSTNVNHLQYFRKDLMNELQFLIYTADNDSETASVIIKGETIWASQKEMARLFDVGVPAISKHLKNIFEEGELEEDSVISKMETTMKDIIIKKDDIKDISVTTDKKHNPISNVIDHPSHYNRGKIEVIDFIEDQGLSFHLGNVIKYIARAGSKGDKLEDLKKARWYLDRYINEVMK